MFMKHFDKVINIKFIPLKLLHIFTILKLSTFIYVTYKGICAIFLKTIQYYAIFMQN